MPPPPDHVPNPEPHDLVLFKTAGSPLEAELIAGVLRDADIPAYVEGGLLTDEFAISQRLLGLNSVRIQIPRDRLADAEAVLAEAREASASVDAEAEAAMGTAPDPTPPPRRATLGRTWVLPVVLAVAALTFLVQWLDALAVLRVVTQSGLTYLDADAQGSDVVYRWRKTGAVASRYVDADANGVPEVVDGCGLDGKLQQRVHDRDQNGTYEKTVLFDDQGAIAGTLFDDDQNGVAERIEEQRAGGHTLSWVDADQDRRVERIEERDSAGKVVRAWIWHDERGFELAK